MIGAAGQNLPKFYHLAEKGFQSLLRIPAVMNTAAHFGVGAAKGLHGPMKRLGSASSLTDFFIGYRDYHAAAGSAAVNPLKWWAQEQTKKLGKEAGGYFNHAEHGTFRKAVAWGGAALIGANVAGIDPLGVTSMANTAAWGYGHYLVGRGIMNVPGRAAKPLGLGYLGLAGLNLLRPGDNLGPM